MKTLGKSRIVLIALAFIAAGALFATYGTVLPAAPFAPVPFDSPTTADSNGKLTAVVDTGSNRALIMNADGDLTGVVSCNTADSPFDAITDACVSGELVYLAGARFKADSDTIAKERVAIYDKGGNFQKIVYEKDGTGETTPSIKSLNNANNRGIVVSYAQTAGEEFKDQRTKIDFDLVSEDGVSRLGSEEAGTVPLHDVAFFYGEESRYITLSVRGKLDDGESDYKENVYDGHVFTAIDLGDESTLYACDDTTGSLCAIAQETSEITELVSGDGYQNMHVNNDIISLSNSKANTVTLCDTSGAIISKLTEARPSIGFSARMLLVWASGLYLITLGLVFGIRKLVRQIKEGETTGVGPMFTAVAVVGAIAIAVGSLSFGSYQKSLETRANEINMCADYLNTIAEDLSKPMEKISSRDKLSGSVDEFSDALFKVIDASSPALALTFSANTNGIGMYCTVYGKDTSGIFNLLGSSSEYVLGSSVNATKTDALEAAFESAPTTDGELLHGHTLRDATQYRLVQIPSSDGKRIVGVIEIGSRMRSFEAALTNDLAQRILALLAMVLVVYLAYSELRACGRCLFTYQQRRQEDASGSVALLTRPFTLAITMLTSIDSVMTVLIARNLLNQAGMGESGALLAIPAVALGFGLVIGQLLYGAFGSRVGLRRLISRGAFVMLLFAVLTGMSVASGNFWLYCAAKFTMSVPFGMLYTLGYSLPRLAHDDKTRALAAGGVKRTDTSAAALGTILGGYAAQTLGDIWVYALVTVACIPVILLALSLLPKGMKPLEKLAHADGKSGHIGDLIRTPKALAIALFIVLPATIAASYASFLFPLFSSNLGLSKSEINNIVVLGQLIVFISIDSIDRLEDRHGKWRISTIAITLLGVVFLLFAIRTTLVWSIAVIAIVAVFCKMSDGWKAMWLKSANESDVPAGPATGAMFATRSLALIIQPFIMGALLGATSNVAVIVIGALCIVCAALFYFVTRRTSLAN